MKTIKLRKQPFINLTPELEKELLESSLAAKKGAVISSSEMHERVKRWLKEKRI